MKMTQIQYRPCLFSPPHNFILLILGEYLYTPFYHHYIPLFGQNFDQILGLYFAKLGMFERLIISEDEVDGKHG